MHTGAQKCSNDILCGSDDSYATSDIYPVKCVKAHLYIKAPAYKEVHFADPDVVFFCVID